METDSDSETSEVQTTRERKAGGRSKFWRLLVLPFIPILALIIQTALALKDSLLYRQEVAEVEEQVSRATELGKLVTKIQLERSLVAFYMFTNSSERFKLDSCFADTNSSLDQLAAWPPIVLPPHNESLLENDFRSRLEDLRSKIEYEDSTMLEIIPWYTEVNKALLQHLTNHIKEADSSQLWRYLVGFKNLLRSIESFGVASMLGISYFSRGFLSQHNLTVYITRIAIGDDLLYSSFNYVPRLRMTNERKYREKLDTMSVTIMENKRREGNEASAIEYYNSTSQYLDHLRQLQKELRNYIRSRVEQSLTEAQRSELLGMAILLLVLVLSPVIIIMVRRAVNTIQMYSKHLSEKAQELKREKQLSDSLLCQMLPPSVAMRLKREQQVPAEYFESVSIYFSDIEGFTEIAAGTTPYQVVMFLNSVYQLFDDTIERYDVYKVETIGDSYMVASGLPVKNGDKHPSEIASMALELLEAGLRCRAPHRPSAPLRMRCGLHTGPCVAGVVGSKMPRYCLFGDTVNTASRMESTGEAFRIHISEEMKSALEKAGGFHITKRGQVDIKGKGLMTTYWLSRYPPGEEPLGVLEPSQPAPGDAAVDRPAYLQRLCSKKYKKQGQAKN